MYKYLFFLGNNPSISLAEIQAKFDNPSLSILSEKTVLLNLAQPLAKPQTILDTMGGTIRIAKFINTFSFSDIQDLLVQFLSTNFLDIRDIGISYYNFSRHISKQLIQTKKTLRQDCHINKRFIFENNQSELKAATLKKNKLIGKGIELTLIKCDDSITIGQTVAIQDIDQYSLRDYGKPKPDTFSGMLPPKLAQMMLSLAHLQPGQTVYDPFCGSGVVLQEALLQNMQIIGSDISEKAVIHTRENLKWLIKKFHLLIPDYHHLMEKNIFPADATYYQLADQVDAIVTEPYLGPAHSTLPTDQFASQIIQNITPIYSQFIINSLRYLKPNGYLVFIIPLIKTNTNQRHSINLESLLDSTIKEAYNLIQFDNRDLIYEQPEQKVLRRLVVLQKN
ncbi:MAG TPA: DNA methyltransferase [bacterium]|nr:DNA methyltransferase [bacterium]